MDDILIFAKRKEEHDETLREFLRRLKNSGITLNKEKCQFGVSNVTFLGHYIDEHGIKADEKKVKAIAEMKLPTDLHGVQRFMGMVNFLGRFVPNLAEITKPLNDLRKKDVIFIRKKAFEKVKDLLASDRVLASFDISKKTMVSADASSYGLGAALKQEHEANEWRPVAFASRKLTKTEQGYAQIEKEALATTWACERYKDFVVEKAFLIETDHKLLLPIFTTKDLNDLTPRLQRYCMRMLQFSFRIFHTPGKYLITVDALSRQPLPGHLPEDEELQEEVEHFVRSIVLHQSTTDERLAKIALNQKLEPTLQNATFYSKNGWPAKCQLSPLERSFNDVRDKIEEEQGLLMRGLRVIIPSNVRKYVLNRIHAVARNRSRNPGFGKTCEKCIENQPLKHEPLIPNDFPRPWQKVGMDLFHYEGSEYLVVVDYFSRFIEVVRLTKLSSEAVVDHCKAIFARHGIPDIHPLSNGQAEAAVKIVKNLMRKNKDPVLALMEYRATPLANGLSPAELLFGRKIRTVVPCTSSSLTPKTVNQSKLRGEEEHRKMAQKTAFDRRHAATKKAELIAGEKVWVKDLRAWGSVIEKASAPRSYIVETPVGTYRRNSLLLASSQQQVDSSETFSSTDSQLPTETEETPGNELSAEELQQQTAIAPEMKQLSPSPGKVSRSILRFGAEEARLVLWWIRLREHDQVGQLSKLATRSLKSYVLRKGQLLIKDMKDKRKGKGDAFLKNLRHDIFENTVAFQISHLMGLMEGAIASWSPFTRGLSLVGRAGAANSLVLGSILHYFHLKLPSTGCMRGWRASCGVRAESRGFPELRLACLKGVQASLRGAANDCYWLVRNQAWLTSPAPNVWLSSRKRRFLMLNENLTLAAAVKIARQWEAVMREQQDLNPFHIAAEATPAREKFSFVYAVREPTLGSRKSRWKSTVRVSGTAIHFKLDPGSDVTLIPFSLYKRYFSNVQLTPTDGQLMAAANQRMENTGTFVAKLRANTREVKETVYVVHHLEQPLLGVGACEDLQLVKRNDLVINGTTDVNPEREFPMLVEGRGLLEQPYHIKLKEGAKPFSIPVPRRVSLPLMPKLKEQLDAMVAQEVIEPVDEPTEWCAPIVLAGNPNGKIRICVDLSRLNLSVEHANSGFWQIKLSEEIQTLTTFITPFGRYKFKRLPFGISSAPEHYRNFGVSNVTFLGHYIDEHGIKADEKKVKAIAEMKLPTDLHGVQRFMGMVNFLGRFVPNLAEITKPLNDLRKKDVIFIRKKAFEKVKDLLASDRVLASFDISKKTMVSADASSYGLGAALKQEHEANEWRPVAFASRKLTKTEQGYAQIEKEALATTWAYLNDLTPRLQRYCMRMLQFSFRIFHTPGKYLITADALSRQPLPGHLPEDEELQEEVEHFVRSIVLHQSTTDERLAKIALNQKLEPTLQNATFYSKNGWPAKCQLSPLERSFNDVRDKIEEEQGLLMRGLRVIIPSNVRKYVLNRIHAGHQGITKCRARAKDHVWWPGIGQEIQDLVKTCEKCIENQPLKHEPLIPNDFPRPWQKVGMDLFHYEGSEYLVVVDYFSRFIEVVRLTKLSSEAVVDHCKAIFARHGIPDIVISDNGP
ncbi:K02A2.6-like [Cordylochernes scorpioides]|uniref:RNA-directed DNA polymerase n=1 Tax=Cordylochernes scorpioides TaxID=51811 RepID=A0ABY6KEG1_9ARAC|nr:K02A2.6-like [Cordylochernes scorpioides]